MIFIENKQKQHKKKRSRFNSCMLARMTRKSDTTLLTSVSYTVYKFMLLSFLPRVLVSVGGVGDCVCLINRRVERARRSSVTRDQDTDEMHRAKSG